MKYLLIALCAIVFSLAFTGHKCEHVFTQVEQANIKIEQPYFNPIGGQGYYEVPQWPTGIQEGKEIICVKCFHVQKQLLDYGKPQHGQTLTGLFSGIDSCLFIGDGNLTFDSSYLIRK